MPKLWDHSIEAHHGAVSEAIFAATESIVAKEGVTALSMSRIAQSAGIGRATLYKYFRDVGELLAAWHRRMIEHHLGMLEQVRAEAKAPGAALEAVLVTYARIRGGHSAHGPAGALHGLPHLRAAHARFAGFIRDVVEEAAKAQAVRRDVTADELAAFAIAALTAAEGRGAKSAERVARLVLDAMGARNAAALRR